MDNLILILKNKEKNSSAFLHWSKEFRLTFYGSKYFQCDFLTEIKKIFEIFI